MDESQPEPSQRMADRGDRNERFDRNDRSDRFGDDRQRRERKVPSAGPRPLKDHPDVVTQRYRVEVGYEHGVKPGQIVGAIANEANIESAFIGHIEIFDTFTTVDLPEGMPTETMDVLKRARVCGRQLDISHFTGQMPERSERRNKPFGDRRPRPEGGRDRPFGDRGDFKRNAPRKFENKPKFDKGGRNDR